MKCKCNQIYEKNQTDNLTKFITGITDGDKAMVIKEDTIEYLKPKGKTFTLDELQTIVDGKIELVHNVLKGYLVICNEEGLIFDLYPNYLAYNLLGQQLVGNVIICPERMFR